MSDESRGTRKDARGAAGSVARIPTAVTVGFGRGISYPFRGMRFVYLRHPELVRFWIWPILLTLAAIVAAGWGAWRWHDDVAGWIWAEPVGEGAWTGFGAFFHGVFEVLLFLLLIGFGLLLAVLLASVFAAPFNDALSEEVERIATGESGPPFRLAALLKDVVRTIGLEVLKLALYAAVMGPLLVLSLLAPGAGQAVYTVFGFVFTAIYFAIDYVDWPAARRDQGIGHRFGLARRRFAPMLGFGTGVWLLLFVPLVNLLFMPAAVAGGTLLYLDLEGSGPRAARDPVRGP